MLSSQRLLILAALLGAGAASCRLAFHALGSRVDATGVVHEPVALLPVSLVLLLASWATLIGAWAMQRRTS
jgi:Protein of unknown function (DUF3955)